MSVQIIFLDLVGCVVILFARHNTCLSVGVCHVAGCKSSYMIMADTERSKHIDLNRYLNSGGAVLSSRIINSLLGAPGNNLLS